MRTLNLPPTRLVDGELLVRRNGGSVTVQRFDAQALEPVGPVVSEELQLSDAESGGLSVVVADGGTAVYVTHPPLRENLLRIRRDGTRERLPFSLPPRLGFRLSPDGRHLVYNEQAPGGGDRDVFLVDLELGTRTRLTFGGQAGYPDFDLTGRRVVYNRITPDDYVVVAKNVDGSGDESVILDTDDEAIEITFVPGSDDLVIRQGNRNSMAVDSDIWLYAPGDPDFGRPIATGPGNQVSPAVSPDGRFVAYGSDETGAQEVFVRSLDDPSARWQVSAAGGIEPLWAPDGTELYYRYGGFIWSVPVDLAGAFRQTGAPTRLFNVDRTLSNINHAAWQISPDGESFYFRDLGAPEVHVILNWLPHIRRLLDEAGG